MRLARLQAQRSAHLALISGDDEGWAAAVVDPATGEVVGGYVGLELRTMVLFQVVPGTTQRIPLLIATASFSPRLGYAISPGTWGIQATLELGNPSNHCYRRADLAGDRHCVNGHRQAWGRNYGPSRIRPLGRDGRDRSAATDRSIPSR